MVEGFLILSLQKLSKEAKGSTNKKRRLKGQYVKENQRTERSTNDSERKERKRGSSYKGIERQCKKKEQERNRGKIKGKQRKDTKTRDMKMDLKKFCLLQEVTHCVGEPLKVH